MDIFFFVFMDIGVSLPPLGTRRAHWFTSGKSGTEYKGNLPAQQHFRLEDRRHGLGIGQLAGHTQLHRLVEGHAKA